MLSSALSSLLYKVLIIHIVFLSYGIFWRLGSSGACQVFFVWVAYSVFGVLASIYCHVQLAFSNGSGKSFSELSICCFYLDFIHKHFWKLCQQIKYF